MPRAWYAYTGPVGDLPPTAAGNWTFITPQSGSPRFECAGNDQLCVISAYYPSPGPAPDPNPLAPLSANIQSYITLALTTSVNRIPQLEKAYLYKRSS
jgi:hypothetical protein